MKLLVKVNLVLAAVFVLGLAATAKIADLALKDNAKEEVLSHARLMMDAAMAARTYTVSEIRPLLVEKITTKFLPQIVPSYAATQTFKNLHTQSDVSEYSYKEATLNPTNPRDRATDWEADVIQHFRDHPEVKEMTGERITPNGPALYIAKQIKIEDAACLACHNTPKAAPLSMLALYGSNNGFGWQKDEIVGSQIVSVPLSVPLKRADDVFQAIMTGMVATFVVILLTVNGAIYWMVLRPIDKMAQIADSVSEGQTDVPELIPQGNDEITTLGTAFNRMRRSLEKALALLD